MLITNAKTGKEYPFVCDSWLGVDSVDGRIEKILPVANDDELKQVHLVFASAVSKGLLDGHIWFSIFLRPKQSCFTRVRRLSACLALIFLTMLVNAMFFGVGDSPDSRRIIWLGNFKVNMTGIIIGIQSSIIVIPPSMIIIEIFRRLRPNRESVAKKDKDAVSSTPSLTQTDSENNQVGEKHRKKKPFMLPNWFKYIAYFLVFACTASSALICFFYSMMWGARKSNEWLASMFTGFFQSILVIQPIKAVFVAALLSIILRKPVQQDAYEEKEDDQMMTAKASDHSSDQVSVRASPVGKNTKK